MNDATQMFAGKAEKSNPRHQRNMVVCCLDKTLAGTKCRSQAQVIVKNRKTCLTCLIALNAIIRNCFWLMCRARRLCLASLYISSMVTYALWSLKCDLCFVQATKTSAIVHVTMFYFQQCSYKRGTISMVYLSRKFKNSRPTFTLHALSCV